MQNGAYKKILNAMPEGVFVFDDKLRVKFTNAAFRRSVSDEVKPVGTLADVVGCREQNLLSRYEGCGCRASRKDGNAANDGAADRTYGQAVLAYTGVAR